MSTLNEKNSYVCMEDFTGENGTVYKIGARVPMREAHAALGFRPSCSSQIALTCILSIPVGILIITMVEFFVE